MIYLTLFTLCMNLLTIATDYIAFFIGWEGVGLTSFLLIGFWFEDKENLRKAKQAFMLTKLTDIGYIVGAAYLTYHNINFMEYPNRGYSDVPFSIRILMFLPCIGKSALFPLFVWLPNAMVAPTPVSAHLHSATMVAAGVFYLTKFYAFFEDLFLPTSLHLGGIFEKSTFHPFVVILLVGFFLCALCAIMAYDIKRLLAFSTISHLSLMYLGFFTTSHRSTMDYLPFIHLTLHAFTKAPLFLIAGVLMHTYHTQDINKLRGVLCKNNLLKVIFLILVLSLSGFPLVGTFWSKFLILHRLEHSSGSKILPIIVTLLSTLYCARFYVLLTRKPALMQQDVVLHKKVEKIPLIAIALLCLFLLIVTVFFSIDMFFYLFHPYEKAIKSSWEIYVSSSLLIESIVIIIAFTLVYIFLDTIEKIIKLIPKAKQNVELEKAYYFIFQVPTQFVQFLCRTTIEELWDEFINRFLASDFMKFVYTIYRFFYNGVLYNYLVIIVISILFFFLVLMGYGIF